MLFQQIDEGGQRLGGSCPAHQVAVLGTFQRVRHELAVGPEALRVQVDDHRERVLAVVAPDMEACLIESLR
ncbi:hypothetical protein [Streptomyces cyaneofuscatus]|uniref:hypothetical protein n=1 Tax=Streptomyces cyaneofuscatus TaxID=66883 RepID=UPI0013DA1F9C|nr:hypothetical protein [Streptomyces cyaneofuscatus]NDZ65291.1 hypothetical protein [Streptomyces cyaneofuscatus]